ncbi:MAG TPA: hypothetical protein V6C81_11015 [Planktothrix sp.]
MNKQTWIERSALYGGEPSAEEQALKETYQRAEKVAYNLLCYSIQLGRTPSIDVKDCAAEIRNAVHGPEKARTLNIRESEKKIWAWQIDYVSVVTAFKQHQQEWDVLRRQLVEQVSQLVNSRETMPTELAYNCQSVVSLIEEGDFSVAEVAYKQHSGNSLKLAHEAFQKLADALAADLEKDTWRLHSLTGGDELWRDLPLNQVSSTTVPEQFTHCVALDAARAAFESINGLVSDCRDFQENARGGFNDTQFSERLLKATGDVDAMKQIEAERDGKLRAYGRARLVMRRRIESVINQYQQVFKLLPAALAEAAAIEDQQLRLRAQNLCLFAARRLKENQKFVRQCDNRVPDRDAIEQDIAAAVRRSHEVLVTRVQSKSLNYPNTRRRPDPYEYAY